MTVFGSATNIYAGGSSSTPTRDFVVRAGTSSTDTRDYIVFYRLNIKPSVSVISVQSSLLTAVYLRAFSAAPSTVEVRSGLLNLFYNPTTGSVIYVSSNNARFGRQYYAAHRHSRIHVESSSATFTNPYLVGRTGSLRIISAYSDFKFLVNGYLPGVPPATRTFQPPSYRIEKTIAMNGRAVRQCLCSRPSEALLTLEYVNLHEDIAEEVLVAYDQSYGTRYGFKLPPEIFSGADSSLVNYMSLINSHLKWFYASKPTIQSVSTGICNLNVQLKAKTQRS